MAILHKNFAQTTLASAITDTGGTSITVTSETSFPAVQFIISIDTEAMLVTTVSTTTWTVTRGYEGSTAATHLNGAAIFHDISAAEADSIAAKKTDNVSATDKVLGRVTAGAGAIEEIACTAAGRALLDDADAAAQLATLGAAAASHSHTIVATQNGLGDVKQLLQYASAGLPKWITVSGDVSIADNGAATVSVEAITYAKMQHVSATDKLLGRSTAGAGDVEEIPLTAAGRALLDDANAAAQLATLGLTATAAELNQLDGVTLTGNNSGDQTLSGLGGLPIGGGTMTGVLYSQANTSYTTAQVRNVIESTADASGGDNGDIWIKYSA